MIEKPVRALSKIEMLEMLRRQEIEIERLKVQREAIIDDIRKEAEEKIQVIYDDAVRRRDEAEAGAKAIADGLRKLFDLHFERLAALRSEFDVLAGELGLIAEQQVENQTETEAGAKQ